MRPIGWRALWPGTTIAAVQKQSRRPGGGTIRRHAMITDTSSATLSHEMHTSACGCATLALGRRDFLQALGGLAAGAALPAVAAPAKPGLIDTHHHFYAPAYQKAWLDFEDSRKIPHFSSQVAWTREKSIEEMDKGGV